MFKMMMNALNGTSGLNLLLVFTLGSVSVTACDRDKNVNDDPNAYQQRMNQVPVESGALDPRGQPTMAGDRANAEQLEERQEELAEAREEAREDAQEAREDAIEARHEVYKDALSKLDDRIDKLEDRVDDLDDTVKKAYEPELRAAREQYERLERNLDALEDNAEDRVDATANTARTELDNASQQLNATLDRLALRVRTYHGTLPPTPPTPRARRSGGIERERSSRPRSFLV